MSDQERIAELERQLATARKACIQGLAAIVRLNNGCYPLPYPSTRKWLRDVADLLQEEAVQ